MRWLSGRSVVSYPGRSRVRNLVDALVPFGKALILITKFLSEDTCSHMLSEQSGKTNEPTNYQSTNTLHVNWQRCKAEEPPKQGIIGSCQVMYN